MEFNRIREKIVLLVLVVFGKSLEDLVFVKIHWLQRGKAGNSDFRMLEGIHRYALGHLRAVRIHGRAVLVDARRHALGVHDSGVILAAHNPAWHEIFQREADMLREQLGSGIGQIYHVGSTVIPGLPAKPIIDIAIEMNRVGFEENLPAHREVLAKIGYRYLGNRGQKGGHMFGKDQNGVRTHAIQVHPRDSAAMKELIRFRQMLLEDSNLALEYAEIKAGLADLFPNQRLIYVWYKTHWVQHWFLEKDVDFAWGRWLVAAGIPTMITILIRSIHRGVSQSHLIY
jgi:GrpB-like predicted nucleotidyltransferase (UPF0157 family)